MKKRIISNQEFVDEIGQWSDGPKFVFLHNIRDFEYVKSIKNIERKVEFFISQISDTLSYLHAQKTSASTFYILIDQSVINTWKDYLSEVEGINIVLVLN